MQTPHTKYILVFIAVAFTLLILGFPVFAIFQRAFADGSMEYINAIFETDTLLAIRLTLMVSVIVLPINIIFGISAAWIIAKHHIRGAKWLMTLIEMPFSISPIVAGLAYLLLYGNYGLLGQYLAPYDIQLMFNVVGIGLVSLFVSCPFIVRSVVPVMEQQGINQEEAGVTLGASGFQVFWFVTLPNIKWGLLYGIILANARVMGEFGAVSVVSGMIRGETMTLPLQVQLLYFDNNVTGAFAAATVLALLACVTLGIRNKIDRKHQ